MKEFCKHYRAMSDNDTCEIGIAYRPLFAANPLGPGQTLPCWGDEVKTCPSAVYPTPEEIAERDREFAALLAKFESDLENDICPHCGEPIKSKKQIGRCVYAYPCGDRLYQGRLR